MRFGREWLAAAAIVAVGVTALTDLVLIAADSGSPAQATANRPWPAPDVPRIVVMPTTVPVPVALPPPVTPRPPRLVASSVAIPVQHVRAPIIDYCPIIEGGLEPPTDVHQVCYWAGGAGIDDRAGTSVLTGHINWAGVTGAFGNLAALRAGELVYTSDAHRAVSRWRIVRVEHRSKTLGIEPAAFVGHSGPRRLYLISCGGAFDAAELSYVDNIYVLARPAPYVRQSHPEPPAPPMPPPVR
jgi:hypothetical protein